MLSGGKWDKLHDISRRVYSVDGIAPTVHTMGGGQQELKIVEPIAYDEQVDEMYNNLEPRVIGGIGEKKSNGGTQYYQQDRIYDDNIAISVTTAFNPYYKSNCRIRKLIPNECFRLMAVKQEDYERACYGEPLSYYDHDNIVSRTMTKIEWKDCWRIMRHRHQADSSLYHLAGDSIVTTCLMAIFGELFGVDYQSKINELVEELKQ